MKLGIAIAIAIAYATLATPASALDVTYRGEIQPLIKAQCAECHGGDSPTLAEFSLAKEKYSKAKEGPRTNTYEALIQLIGWPDTGALMRRLDDGTNTPDRKPGNMYKYLGENDKERAAKLLLIKAWVGEGAWNLNRWEKRGDIPAITKDQLDRIRILY